MVRCPAEPGTGGLGGWDCASRCPSDREVVWPTPIESVAGITVVVAPARCQVVFHRLSPSVDLGWPPGCLEVAGFHRLEEPVSSCDIFILSTRGPGLGLTAGPIGSFPECSGAPRAGQPPGAPSLDTRCTGMHDVRQKKFSGVTRHERRVSGGKMPALCVGLLGLNLGFRPDSGRRLEAGGRFVTAR